MKYSGIDLHSNNSVVTVMDEEDRIVAEKRLPNDLAKILGLLMPWREEIAGVVVESTFNWYWLVDGLQAAGFKVHLANTGVVLMQRHGSEHLEMHAASTREDWRRIGDRRSAVLTTRRHPHSR